MNFVALDFETADELIPCELGICVVKGGVVAEVRSWLIKPSCYPYMNYWHEQIHGISTAQLETAPSFDTVWTEARPYFEGGLLIAHNAKFDISVLRAALREYHLDIPNAAYLCSVILARRIWNHLPSHRLNELCRHFNIPLIHHRAGNDAEACAKLILKMAKDTHSMVSSSMQQLSLDIFRPDGMSLLEVARELKVKPKAL